MSCMQACIHTFIKNSMLHNNNNLRLEDDYFLLNLTIGKFCSCMSCTPT